MSETLGFAFPKPVPKELGLPRILELDHPKNLIKSFPVFNNSCRRHWVLHFLFLFQDGLIDRTEGLHLLKTHSWSKTALFFHVPFLLEIGAWGDPFRPFKCFIKIRNTTKTLIIS